MVLPNARRCLAYATDASSAPCAIPTACAAMPTRPPSEQFQRDLQALAFFAQAIPFRDFAIGERDFRRARSAQTHLILVSRHSKTGK